jgi:hypothetical protein
MSVLLTNLGAAISPLSLAGVPGKWERGLGGLIWSLRERLEIVLRQPFSAKRGFPKEAAAFRF